MNIKKKDMLRVLQRVVKVKKEDRNIKVIKQDFNQMVNDLIKLKNYNNQISNVKNIKGNKKSIILVKIDDNEERKILLKEVWRNVLFDKDNMKFEKLLNIGKLINKEQSMDFVAYTNESFSDNLI